jgi:hypothetical protein
MNCCMQGTKYAENRCVMLKLLYLNEIKAYVNPH